MLRSQLLPLLSVALLVLFSACSASRRSTAEVCSDLRDAYGRMQDEFESDSSGKGAADSSRYMSELGYQSMISADGEGMLTGNRVALSAYEKCAKVGIKVFDQETLDAVKRVVDFSKN